MFVGQYLRSLDKNRRIYLPVKFLSLTRADKHYFYLIPLKGPCIGLFVESDWNIMAEEIKYLDRTTDNYFIRNYNSKAFKTSLDKRGRIRIPNNLCEYAKLIKDVLIFGLINPIELWNPEIYKSVSNNIMDNEK